MSYNVQSFDSLMLHTGFEKGDSNKYDNNGTIQYSYFSNKRYNLGNEHYGRSTMFFNVSDTVVSICFASLTECPYKKTLQSFKRIGFKLISKYTKGATTGGRWAKYYHKGLQLELSTDNTIVKDKRKGLSGTCSITLRKKL